MAGTGSSDRPPTFEDPFDSGDVEQQLYATVLQTRTPTTAGALAEAVGCDPKTARKYLRWFAELGIVTEHDGHPATYERNDAYFQWRRINQLASDHSVDELQQHVSELTEKVKRYEHRYDAVDPGAIDALEVAAQSDERTIDDVYGDLGDWETARRERQLYERARQQRVGSTERVSG
jgi:predicted transcriptional regulator